MEKETPALERLIGLVKDLRLSNTDLARISEKSTGTVSLVLNGKYRGRPEVIEEMLASLEELSRQPSDIPPVKWLTEGETIIRGILNLTYHSNGFAAVVGPSGLGKTFTAKYFAETHSGVAYARCSDGMSMGDAIQLLLDITSSPGYGTKTQKLKKAIRALKDKNIRMILIDEADLLVTEISNKPAILKKISVFREVKEAGIGVALIGLESFDDTLRIVGETYVTSRIDFFGRIDNPSGGELSYYLANQGWDPELPEARTLLAQAPKNGLFRFLEKIANAAKYFGSLPEARNMIYAPGGHFKEVLK
jgi:DNA transposition AAA+ family ATPase